MDTMTFVAVIGTVLSFTLGRYLKLTNLGAAVLATLFLALWSLLII